LAVARRLTPGRARRSGRCCSPTPGSLADVSHRPPVGCRRLGWALIACCAAGSGCRGSPGSGKDASPSTGTVAVTDGGPGTPRPTWSAAPRIAAGVRTAFPVKVHESGRYLVDGDGTPWRIQADAAWLMSVNASAAEVGEYLSTRRAQGFNAFYLMAVVHP